jgi:hypothetical protein
MPRSGAGFINIAGDRNAAIGGGNAPRQWKTLFAYFLSFNKKQVACRGESRRF